MRNVLEVVKKKKSYFKIKGIIQSFLKKGQVDSRALFPVIIFQPGKVGSSSVRASLLRKYDELGIFVPVYQAQVLENIDARIEYVVKHRKAPAHTVKLLMNSKKLRQQIEEQPGQIWNVINLVRDPVAIKVSALFQTLYEYVPDWKKRLAMGEFAMSDLDNILFKEPEFGIGKFESWYEKQVKPLWGIDIFDYPFSREQGYQIYHSDNVNLIIFRLEDLNRVASQAFEDLLGIKDLEMVNVNLGEQKDYAELYRQFRQRPLPAHYVDAIYNTRFARHFYSAHEIEEFSRKWKKS